MAHQIGKKGDIIKLFKEIFSKPVPEGVRIHCFRRNLTAYGQRLKLTADSAGGDLVSIPVDK